MTMANDQELNELRAKTIHVMARNLQVLCIHSVLIDYV